MEVYNQLKEMKMMDTEQFDGHTPGPWTLNDIEGRQIWKCLFNGECFTDPSTYDRPGYEEVLIATMAPLPPEDDPLAEAAFERMMADKMLMAAAPDLLAEVKRLHRWLDKQKNTCPLCFGKIAWGLDKGVELRHCEDCDYDSPYGGEQE